MTSLETRRAARPFRVELWCELPPYDYKNTPSVKKGLSSETETSLRIWGCQFIQSTGQLLQCPQVALLTLC
jgi:hypothetical protein